MQPIGDIAYDRLRGLNAGALRARLPGYIFNAELPAEGGMERKKAYENDGELPYEELIKKLKSANSDFDEDKPCRMGGFVVGTTHPTK